MQGTHRSLSKRRDDLGSNAEPRRASRPWLALAAAAAVAGCAHAQPATSGDAPTTASTAGATSAPAPTWSMPYIFQHREATATTTLNAPEFAGKGFAFTSAATPTLAKVIAAQMQGAGLTVVPPGTDGALNVELQFGAWIAPPQTPRKMARNVSIAAQLDAALDKSRKTAEAQYEEQGRTLLASADASGGAPGKGVVVPLAGYDTYIGSSNVSVGLASLLLENVGTATGARKWFNGLFGADERGFCLGSAVHCDRRKGPIGEAEIKGTLTTEGRTVEIFSREILVQTRNNLGQPLAYAITDWRDAAIGKPTAQCLSLAKGETQKTPGCEPVLPSLTIQDFFR